MKTGAAARLCAKNDATRGIDTFLAGSIFLRKYLFRFTNSVQETNLFVMVRGSCRRGAPPFCCAAERGKERAGGDFDSPPDHP